MAKTSDYSEVDAMRDVDTALGKIEADGRQRIINWAASKYQLLATGVPDSGGELRAPQSAAQPSKDIKAFVSQKRPDGFYERIACLVYHMEKSQSKTDVGRKDIVQANSDARLSKMTNASVFIKNTTHTYGYLTSLGGRKFALSARGEAVVNALPDRSKVEEALTTNPFGRKAKRKTRSKK